jgi:hypothetical protein
MDEENKEKIKLHTGAWDAEKGKGSMKPMIKFQLNKSEIIDFPEDFDRPDELPVKDALGKPLETGEVYYRFDVMQNGNEAIFFTAAVTLIEAFKNFKPLAKKTLKITKKQKGTTQYFDVEEVKK